jgi:ribosomal protein L30
MRATAKKRKMISLKQIRSAARVTREARETLKALGLGKLYDFHRLPDTKEVRSMVAKVGHLVSILDGPDILFPSKKTAAKLHRRRRSEHARNVFINCPFDDEYTPIFEAIVFTIQACGFRPVCARSRLNSSDVRLQKIVDLSSPAAVTRFMTCRALSLIA